VATFLFLYITILTVMGVKHFGNAFVGIQGIAWAFDGMIFALVYCIAGISSGDAIRLRGIFVDADGWVMGLLALGPWDWQWVCVI
jgi:hypothetical protein